MNLIEKASYIAAPKHFGAVCPKFRRSFQTDKEVRSATLTVSALGVYEASLNGKRVGSFILAPGFTSYRHRLQYQSYSVTHLIGRDNTLDIMVGRGWCCGRLGWTGQSAHFCDTPALIAALQITYADGTEETILTDSSWRATRSPILSAELYDGEEYDARVTDSAWEDIRILPFTHDSLIPQEGEEIREVETIRPVRIFKTPCGETVVDFGQNFTGYVSLHVSGNPGDVCDIDHFEILDDNGNAHTENLRSAKQKLLYTLAGGEAEFKPHFTFYGFRYLRINRFPKEPSLSDFTGIVVCSDMKRTGQFECSDPMVNRLYRNVIWGQRGNFLDIPTDCPQRDERLGWTGDALVFCKTAALNFDCEKFFTKWLADMEADQFDDGGIPAVIPNVLGREGANSAGWGDAACVCPWQLYLAYGNPELLARQFRVMQRWVDYIRAQSGKESVWNTGHQFADWLALDKEGDQQGATDHGLIATAFFAGSTEILIKAGKILGRDMAEYERLHRDIVNTFRETYIKDGALITPTQTAHVLALHFRLVEDEALYAKRLAALITENGMHLNTGFLGTAYLMETLSEHRYTDIAYSLLLQKEFPSWLFMVRNGATTFWERWDAIGADGKMYKYGMNSYNHYAYGAVASWMYGYMAGIRTEEQTPGYRRFVLNPQPDPRIRFVRASLETRHGLIRSEWYAQPQGGYRYIFEVPDGTEADVTLGAERFTLQPGHYEFDR